MKFKGFDLSKPVRVYRNLKHGRKSKPLYSIMQGGRVIARRHRVLLSQRDNYPCVFWVNDSGRQRVLKQKRKNVHAFVIGYLASAEFTPKGKIPGAMGIDEHGKDLPARVMYNPYAAGYFFIPDSTKVNGTPVRGAMAALLNENGISASYTY